MRLVSGSDAPFGAVGGTVYLFCRGCSIPLFEGGTVYLFCRGYSIGGTVPPFGRSMFLLPGLLN